MTVFVRRVLIVKLLLRHMGKMLLPQRPNTNLGEDVKCFHWILTAHFQKVLKTDSNTYLYLKMNIVTLLVDLDLVTKKTSQTMVLLSKEDKMYIYRSRY